MPGFYKGRGGLSRWNPLSAGTDRLKSLGQVLRKTCPMSEETINLSKACPAVSHRPAIARGTNGEGEPKELNLRKVLYRISPLQLVREERRSSDLHG